MAVWGLDERADERERGITMTVSITYFSTMLFYYSPGHKYFTPKKLCLGVLLSEVDDDGRTFDYRLLVDETLDEVKRGVRFEERAFVVDVDKNGDGGNWKGTIFRCNDGRF